jgi:hypothetical protein
MRANTLVLRRFRINEAANGEPCVDIIGRPSGLVAWLLTIMGLATETHLTVTDMRVSLKNASLSGELTHFVPLPHVSSTHCGFSKPIGYLVIGAAIAVFGIINGMSQRDGAPLFFGGIIIGLLFFIAYFLSKKIRIEIRTDGGYPLQIQFKPSVIEGVPVNIEYATQALSLLNEKVLQAA